jgi:Leucine-rich repeat (LRR) protein
LSEIDVSNNVNLTFLDISANQIKELDVSNNIALTELRCETNDLNTLDITNNILLTGLYCGFNEIASLDISNNTLLTYMWLVGMPYLNEVCVWEIPFPPAGVEVNRYQSPNIYYTVECATSIEKRDRVKVSIFPNPTMKLLTVETSNSNQYHFEITSLNGQLLFSIEMEGTTHHLDLSTFESGVYFITIRSKDIVTTRKIVKL